MCAKSLQSWLTLCDPMDYSHRYCIQSIQYNAVKYSEARPLVEGAWLWHWMPDTRTNLWLDVRMHVRIFESCQLEGSQVGGLLYTIKKNSWNQRYCFWKLILIPTCLCFISSLQSEKAGTFSFLPLTGILRTNGKIISKWLELLEEKLSVNLSYYYYYHHQLQSGFKS